MRQTREFTADVGIDLHLLGGPWVGMAGRRRCLPEGSKRLVVLVALRGSVPRRQAAELLWPAVDPPRAAGNLRSAAWRLRGADLPLLAERDGSLRLAPAVTRRRGPAVPTDRRTDR